MNDSEIKFKSDTGLSPMVKIETTSMIEDIDTYPLQELKTAKEVIDIIELCDYDWSVKIDDLPEEYVEFDDVKIYRPVYIKWLEEQLNLKP